MAIADAASDEQTIGDEILILIAKFPFSNYLTFLPRAPRRFNQIPMKFQSRNYRFDGDRTGSSPAGKDMSFHSRVSTRHSVT